MVYGEDDRIDVYQAFLTRNARLADSTVALMKKSDLQAREGKKKSFDIKSGVFGEEYHLCKNEPFYEQPNAAFCSGSLVGKDLIITAGHCIRDTDDCANTNFVFNYSVKWKGKFPTTAKEKNVYGCKEIVARELDGRGADFAVIRLDREVKNHRPLRINRGEDLKNGDRVGVIGHPAGLPTKIDFGKSEVRDFAPNGYFVANLDTYGGNSGSAVFNAKTGLIEGILVRGENDFVIENGCYVSNRCPADGCRGEDVTKISALTKHIPELTRTLEWPKFADEN